MSTGDYVTKEELERDVANLMRRIADMKLGRGDVLRGLADAQRNDGDTEAAKSRIIEFERGLRGLENAYENKSAILSRMT